jgi:hypothetical protein
MLETARPSSVAHIHNLPDALGTTVTWVDTSHAGSAAFDSRPKGKLSNQKSFVNEYEAKCIAALVQQLVQQEALFEVFDALNNDEQPIGIICMYSEQKRLLVRTFNSSPILRNLVERRIVKIDTVDSYQGKENDIVIISLVRNNQRRRAKFLSSEQRINVALSRAKERLYVVGSSGMWVDSTDDNPLARILAYVDENSGEEFVRLDSRTFLKED